MAQLWLDSLRSFVSPAVCVCSDDDDDDVGGIVSLAAVVDIARVDWIQHPGLIWLLRSEGAIIQSIQ